MSNPLLTSLNIDYQRLITDCRDCANCEQMILTDMFQLVVTVSADRIESERFIYCESCYNLLNDKPGET